MTYENKKMLNYLNNIYGDKMDTLYVFEGSKANRFMKYFFPNIFVGLSMNNTLDHYDIQKSCVSINSIVIHGKHYVLVVYIVQHFYWNEKYSFTKGMKKILDILSSKFII